MKKMLIPTPQLIEKVKIEADIINRKLVEVEIASRAYTLAGGDDDITHLLIDLYTNKGWKVEQKSDHIVISKHPPAYQQSAGDRMRD